MKKIDAALIRKTGTTDYASEADDGDIMLEPLGPNTLIFERGSERLYSNMSACPGGHEGYEEVHVVLTVEEVVG